MRWHRWILVWALLTGLLYSAVAQVGQPVIIRQMADAAMKGQRWEDAASGYNALLALKDWPFPNPREDCLFNLSIALQRLARWQQAHDVLTAYLDSHTLPSQYIPMIWGHLAAVEYGRSGEQGLDHLVATLFDDPLYATDKIKQQQIQACCNTAIEQMGGVGPLDSALTRYVQSHPACPVTADILKLQLQLLTGAGDNREAWRRAQTWYLDQVGTNLDVALLKTLADTLMKLGDPDQAVALLTAVSPVTPDPQKELPPVIEQCRLHARKLAARKQEIAQKLPAVLEAPDSSPEALQACLTELSEDLPGAVYWVDSFVQQYLAAQPNYPRRVELQLAIAHLYSDVHDHQAAIGYSQAMLPGVKGTPMEQTLVILIAAEEAVRGNYVAAGDQLLQSSPAISGKIDTKLQALKYYRRAGDVGKAGAVLKTIGTNSPPDIALLEAAYWLALHAAETNDAATVKVWVDLLNTAAPEDARATAARKLLSKLQ